MNEISLDHEFSVEFRAEIKNLGWRQVIADLLVSKSEKNPKRKGYIRRECAKKPSLSRQIRDILTELKDSAPCNVQTVQALEREIF